MEILKYDSEKTRYKFNINKHNFSNEIIKLTGYRKMQVNQANPCEKKNPISNLKF